MLNGSDAINVNMVIMMEVAECSCCYKVLKIHEKFLEAELWISLSEKVTQKITFSLSHITQKQTSHHSPQHHTKH